MERVKKMMVAVTHVKVLANQDNVVKMENVLVVHPNVMERVKKMMVAVTHVKVLANQDKQDKHVLVENVLQILLILVMERIKILLALLEHVVKID